MIQFNAFEIAHSVTQLFGNKNPQLEAHTCYCLCIPAASFSIIRDDSHSHNPNPQPQPLPQSSLTNPLPPTMMLLSAAVFGYIPLNIHLANSFG